MKPVVILIACCSIVLFAACKKGEGANTPRGKELVAGKWQTIAVTATLNYKGKDTTIDVYSTWDECDKDDFVLYTSNGKASIDENGNKCPDDGQVETFNWALLDNETRLALVDSNPDTFDVVELNSTQMKIKIVKPNSSGTPVTTVYTEKNIR